MLLISFYELENDVEINVCVLYFGTLVAGDAGCWWGNDDNDTMYERGRCDKCVQNLNLI